MGSHRGEQRRRRVSKGPVIAAVTIVLVVLLAIGWFRIRDRANEREEAAAGSCVEGETTLVVAADPDIAEPLQNLAMRYNDTDPVVRDHCVNVAVNSLASQQVRDAIVSGVWDEATLGPRPALWVPQSTGVLASLGRDRYEGDPKSIASSTVVLAMPPALAAALQTANIGWNDLPRLQADPNSLAAIGLSDWDGLRLTLPVGPGSGTTAIAAEAVAATVADAGGGPLTEDAVRSRPVVDAISSLAAAAPAAETTTAALSALAAQTDPAKADIHAVPATEQQITTVGSEAVARFAPAGATVVADYPGVELAGVDETQHRAADLFVDFLQQPDQLSTLADNGFRTGEVERSLQPAADPVVAQLTSILSNPVAGSSATVLVDVSSSMGQDGRLAGVVDALRAYVASAPATSGLGLWSYSKDLDGTTPYRIEVRTEPLQPERKRILDDSLGNLRANASSRDQAYPTLIEAYKAAVSNFVAGKTNSIVLVTDGPDDDSSVTGRQLLDAVAAAADPAKPVRIDVVAIGAGPTSDTLQQLADRTGGSLVRVPGPGSQLTDALDDRLR